MYNNINPGQVAIGDVAGKGQASNSTPDRKPPQFLTSSWATTKDVVAAAGKSARETFEDIKFDPAGVFGETKNDVVDIYRKAQGDTGLCTRCESFPSMDIRAAAAESITWHTPLSRLLYHADWCQLCSFLLTMLCRPENDPLKHAEVAAHLPSSLRGMSMKEWTAKGWKYAEDNWPFGKGEFRAEGATYRFGHASDQAQALFKQALFKQSLRNAKTIRNASPSKKAAAERTKAEVWAAAAASSVMNSDNVQQRLLDEGRRSMTRHQKPCNLVLNIITNKNSNGAGMVFASLCGFGNRPQGDMHTLSCFRLRVTYPGLQGVPGPRTALWYGNVLHKQWIDLSIGRYWIKECLERHDENCSRPGWSAALENLDFLRVIDVDKMCLYETKRPGSCRFVALSYKWGDVAACTLRADNIHALSRPGGLSAVMDTLPQTIIDAIEVVRTLGERFLWVDSFCIQQDAGDEKARQIAAMDRVYGSALLTIVAASGDNANAGIRGVRSIPMARNTKPGVPRDLHQSCVQLDPEETRIIAPFENTQDITSSPWESRAWTFQEKVLSRRLLIFCGEEAVWHCRGMICREDMMNDDAEKRCKPLDWFRLNPQHFRPSEGSDPYWVDGSFVRDKNGKTHLVRSSAFGEYTKIAKAFSQRQLTHKADVIPALQGLINILSRALLSEFRYGLPESLLDVALLWAPGATLTRRRTTEAFPSWSWAGWEGSIAYGSCLSITRNEYGKAIKAEAKELGDEGIRPLIYWYALGKDGLGLRRLDSILGAMSEVPREWEGTPSGVTQYTQSEQKSRILAEVGKLTLQKHHLVFQTSCVGCSVWSTAATKIIISKGNGLTVKATKPRSTGGPLNAEIKNSDFKTVGSLVLDAMPPAAIAKVCKLVVIAEGQPSELGLGRQDAAEYSCYIVMLLQIGQQRSTFERRGMGKINKTAWNASQPFPKTIVLG